MLKEVAQQAKDIHLQVIYQCWLWKVPNNTAAAALLDFMHRNTPLCFPQVHILIRHNFLPPSLSAELSRFNNVVITQTQPPTIKQELQKY